jgi:glycosyltransferase involved in cell wall biosynthesis
MPKDSHSVSVIIPTIGRASLEQCLEALRRQTRLADEIIVLKDLTRRGPAWARNEGIRQARGDLLAFTDDDCIPPLDWLEQLIRAIDKYDAAGAGGPLAETDPLLLHIRKRYPSSDQEQIDTAGFAGNSANIVLRRTWVERLAQQDGCMFNEEFKQLGSEDWEFVWRLRHCGGTMVFVPVPVQHLRRETPRSFLHRQFTRGKGIAFFFKIQRIAHSRIPPHQSLVWGNNQTVPRAHWLMALWYKAIGPFDSHSFPSPRDFWLFWLGEKLQGLGFVWGLLTLQVPKYCIPNSVRDYRRDMT